MTNDPTTHSYKKVESERGVNIDTIKQEIEVDKLDSNSMDEDDINLYHEIITNKIEKENTITSQMEQGSILSNVVNYIQ